MEQRTAHGHEAWREMISTSFVPLEAEAVPGGRRAFRGRLAAADRGGIGVSTLQADPHTVHRTEELVARGGGGMFKLSLQLSGRGVLMQEGREVVLEPGRLALYDTSKPYTLSFDREFTSHVMMFPHAALAVPAGRAGEVTAMALEEDRHLGPAVGGFLRQTVGTVPLLDPAVGTRLARNVVDLVGTLVTDLLGLASADADAPLPSSSRDRERQRAAVLEHVRAHLADPGLDPESVAAAHFMSVRSLHLLFEGTGQTVAALIRSERLERCRVELQDPALAGRPVAVVGARWGFADPAHFSRAFRARYGMTPGQCRREAA